MRRSLYILLLNLVVVMMMPRSGYAQSNDYAITITGVVRDSVTHEPIPYPSIYVVGTNGGVLASEDGAFRLSISQNGATRIDVKSIGYKTKRVWLSASSSRRLTIDLVPTELMLADVVVRPQGESYSKKNNPAVVFVKKIRDRQDMTDPRRNDFYSYDKYERITLGLNNFTDQVQNSWMFEQFPFLIEHVDSSEVSGKPILNVSVKEKYSNILYRKSPESQKEIVSGIKRNGLDDFNDQESVQVFLDDIFREIDLYQNDITILQNRFVSPLSRIAPDFYKFYLTDTVDVGGEMCVELSFVPHSSESFGFVGKVYVPENDSTMFIKKIVMGVPKDINLNFIDKMYISQEYAKAADGSRLKLYDDMIVEVSVIPGAQGIYARRNTAYANHSFERPDDLSVFEKMQAVIIADDAYIQENSYWDEYRLIPMAENERRVQTLVDRLRSVPLYYWAEKVVKVLVSGYISTGKESKWDFGPMNTTISGNEIEGVRLRVGGITTANFSKRLFFRGFVAYGTKDHRFKYNAEVEYSFNDKKYHSREFPIHSIKLSHLYDVDQLGQHYLFTNKDNIFLSLKRGDDTQMTYHRVTDLEYKLELHNNFSVTAGVRHERQEATEYLPFVTGDGRVYGYYDETTFNVRLRYAPGEKFYQTKSNRYPINYDAPVFVLSHSFAPKGLFGSEFAINRTELSMQKRFWFSAFGYTDVIVKAGYVWSSVPYPNLLIPNANLSYTIQPESYALMNPMEFINDSYVSWDLTYWANGLILNRIPLLKKLQLREVFTFRGIYGKLSDKNDPMVNSALFEIPTDAEDYKMTSVPYMEVGVGVENILKCLRVDYVWRLTYRNTPNTDKSGVRIALHFTF